MEISASSEASRRSAADVRPNAAFLNACSSKGSVSEEFAQASRAWNPRAAHLKAACFHSKCVKGKCFNALVDSTRCERGWVPVTYWYTCRDRRSLGLAKERRERKISFLPVIRCSIPPPWFVLKSNQRTRSMVTPQGASCCNHLLNFLLSFAKPWDAS